MQKIYQIIPTKYTTFEVIMSSFKILRIYDIISIVFIFELSIDLLLISG
jgi:hypothetical protein